MVTFRFALAATHTVCFDLPRIERDREVGNGCVFGLPGAMRDDRGVVVTLGTRDGIVGVAERADLVDFDKDGVGDMFVDARVSRVGWITNRPSPTSYARLSSSLVKCSHPSQSSSARPTAPPVRITSTFTVGSLQLSMTSRAITFLIFILCPFSTDAGEVRCAVVSERV